MTRKKAQQDTSYLQDALPAFISEAQEQIETIERLLLELEDAPNDRERLDALFRCAHTVKGSGGVFGLEAVVAFTHHVETLLDMVRDGQIALTPEISTLLLQSNDQIRDLISLPPGGALDGEAAMKRDALVAHLEAACKSEREPATAEPAPDANRIDAALPEPGRQWQLEARFGRETFRNGMDPLTITRYLADMGELSRQRMDRNAVPLLDELDPESCHVALQLSLDTDSTRAEIEAAFVFVREDCELTLTEPASAPDDLAARIAAEPDAARLGDLLVGVGAISQAQLGHGLGVQAKAPAPPGQILQTTAGVSAKVVDAAVKKQQSSRDAAAANSEDGKFIRVQASRLDAVINLLGELVIASAGASQLAQDTRQRRLVEANLQISQLVEEIRNGTLQLRMVPIGETFARFRRVVRDTANELGKNVQLELVGGDTEMDKSVVERIADPLMHLVRNALDHGIGMPDVRISRGKSPQGTITLSARHDAGQVVISVSDDGNGMDPVRLRAKAVEKGLISGDRVLSDSEAFNLIFEPGFSTAAAITNLSGRGVGMDVVRRNIEALRGTVTLHSTPMVGSRVEIRLPLTLAIIDGFLVGVGSSRYIFPLETVIEVIETRRVATPDARGRSVMELRGQPLPVVDLRTLYHLDEPLPEQRSVVVIRSGEARYGVVVDRLLGQHQTVIKPLGRLFRSLRGISGSSILGNGDVALIFDVPALATLSAQAGIAVHHPTAPAAPLPAPACIPLTA